MNNEKSNYSHFFISAPTSEESMKLRESFEKLLANKHGLAAFRAFLVSEFSEENIAFYLACEDYRSTKSPSKLIAKANKIYEEFVKIDAPREVNIDHETRAITKKNLERPTESSFNLAQNKIYTLMEKDCYPRFLRSAAYQEVAGRLTGKVTK
ncbi:regulator of G-protein signaling 16-like [Scleropages formosus]|uniref:Regulator of G-protein signaling 16-like n=1 Tax=Scleropages formosus TaxID=113540 RepID=A0A0P7XH84_SCLFO|nr:regulator of G-protein signaling 16-like [Scleropages formosus]